MYEIVHAAQLSIGLKYVAVEISTAALIAPESYPFGRVEPLNWSNVALKSVSKLGVVMANLPPAGAELNVSSSMRKKNSDQNTIRKFKNKAKQNKKIAKSLPEIAGPATLRLLKFEPKVYQGELEGAISA